MTIFEASGEKALFENIVRKWENAGNQHFLIFLLYFLLYQTEIFILLTLICRLRMRQDWKKKCICVKLIDWLYGV